MARAQNTKILITGASSGIGRATSLYLAGKQYQVIGASRSVTRLESLKAEASERDLAITAFELDINNDEAVRNSIPLLLEEHGTIDVLVNNAGYALWGPLERLSIGEVKDQFETNFFGPIRVIKAVLPAMVRQGRGTIINVTSVEGRLGTPFNAAYAASKFALEGMSESLRTELWPLGVRVAVVEPGLIRTDFQRNSVIASAAQSESDHYSQYLQRYHTRHARFDRWAGSPTKVAKVIHRIIRSPRPAFRYLVGLDARMGMLGARFLPERLFQAMVSRATIR